jgi:hypothetical protein
MVIANSPRRIAAVAAVFWLAVTVTLATAHWSLSCTVDGNDANGIDCLQENAMPHAGSAPASWFGFVPLVLLWLAVSSVLVWCALAARRGAAGRR